MHINKDWQDEDRATEAHQPRGLGDVRVLPRCSPASCPHQDTNEGTATLHLFPSLVISLAQLPSSRTPRLRAAWLRHTLLHVDAWSGCKAPAQRVPEPWVPASPPTTRLPSACSHLPLLLASVFQLAGFSLLLFPGCCSLGMMFIGTSLATAIRETWSWICGDQSRPTGLFHEILVRRSC